MILLGTSVHVRAAVEKQFDELEDAPAIDTLVYSVIQIQIAKIDGCP